MYNRYIRDHTGGYTRVPQEEALPFSQKNASSCEDTTPCSPPPQSATSSLKDSGFLRRTLDQLHLEHIDSGDLLLLGLLFFLFREGADEELLAALGLLLIL